MPSKFPNTRGHFLNCSYGTSRFDKRSGVRRGIDKTLQDTILGGINPTVRPAFVRDGSFRLWYNGGMMRAYVFIDGNNFYFKLRSLTDSAKGRYRLSSFNFRAFSEWLTRPHSLEGISYYIGAVKQQESNEKSKKMFADQQRLLMRLQGQEVSFVLGHLIRHPDKTYHEKGVDVRLAVEMIRYARQNKYNIAYLLSSDTDLVPAVEEVQSFGKKIQYVGVPKGQSYGLTKAADDVRLLRLEDIERFFL